MTHIPLPDLDQMTGASNAGMSVYGEHVDISAHSMAAATSDVWEMTPLQDKNGFGRAVGQNWMVDEWCFSEYLMPPILTKLEKHHVRDSSSHIVIERWLSGEEHGIHEDGEVFHNSAGTMEFFDQVRNYKSVLTWRRMETISTPREKLGLPEDGPIILPDISETNAIGKLVFAEWRDLFADLKSGAGHVTTVKMDQLMACLKIAIGVDPQREDVRAYARDAMFRQICRFIEQNLEDPDLSTKTLLDQFGVSRATLYRMFESLGGVRNYVTHRRAMSALFFLSKNDGRRGFVQAACERWGFSSPANFNRTIQRLFGNSPKALFHDRKGARRERLSLTDFIYGYLDVAYNGVTGGIPELAA
ncbi:MAG: AraC family transcriptional regulator [Pseudomonadota bacterium]